MVDSVFQPQYAQNEPFDFTGYDCGEDLLGENERLTEENRQVKEENRRLIIENKTEKAIIKRQADEIERLKLLLINSQLENEKRSKEMRWLAA